MAPKEVFWHMLTNTMHRAWASAAMVLSSAGVCWPQYWLTHWGRDKMATNFQAMFSNGFSWMKNFNFLNEISLKLIDNMTALVQIMAWRRPGDKPLFEPMLVRLPMHICVIRCQWFYLPLVCSISSRSPRSMEMPPGAWKPRLSNALMRISGWRPKAGRWLMYTEIQGDADQNGRHIQQ